MKTAKFITEEPFNKTYFTQGKIYEGRHLVNNCWEVNCDLGYKRVIIPNVPSPHLITRGKKWKGLFSEDKFCGPCQTSTGKFIFASEIN
jgi:hypothetical protein